MVFEAGRVTRLGPHLTRPQWLVEFACADPAAGAAALLVASTPPFIIESELGSRKRLATSFGEIALVDHTVAAGRALVELCATWGGGAMPLMPVTPGSEVDERWSRILIQSNIDAIQRSELISAKAVATSCAAPSTVAHVSPGATASTCRVRVPIRSTSLGEPRQEA